MNLHCQYREADASNVTDALNLRKTTQRLKYLHSIRLCPTDDNQRILSRSTVSWQCRNADESHAAKFSIYTNQRKKVAYFRPLEEIAQVKQRNAKLLGNS